MTGFTLDAGALIAYERNDRRVVQIIEAALDNELDVVVPAAALAQVWRDGRTQARLAKFLQTEDVEIVPLDDHRAREAGQLCGVSKTTDIVDASVVMCARLRKHKIVTSDPEDLARLDPRIELIEC